ncbi:hypothetical protein EVJ58_g5733 [Rhodofomes roseus]|uniref:Uncharacterized protein n=1 Tax=Rhodofomes roseus TaxID=34475 RepID=A0A4Y9YAC5_9APHY|nr:hypothetical protein EVJ58_g5733 [Rhodofomes roseus]
MIGESSSPSSSTSTIDASESENSSDYLALIAELTLQDIDDISASRKGKGNALAPKSDDEFAFDLLAEEARSMLFLARDMAFAQSLDDALQADYEILQEASRADEVARCDREYALALQEGRPPPSTRMESDVAVPVVDSSPSTPISPK